VDLHIATGLKEAQEVRKSVAIMPAIDLSATNHAYVLSLPGPQFNRDFVRVGHDALHNATLATLSVRKSALWCGATQVRRFLHNYMRCNPHLLAAFRLAAIATPA